MQLRCPNCLSEELTPISRRSPEALRCANCGETLAREDAFVSVREARAGAEVIAKKPLFSLDRGLARAELCDLDGAIRAITPFGDADELNRLFHDALDCDIIQRRWPRARLYVYPDSIANPQPLIAVDLGCGPLLLDREPRLSEGASEDPVEFTLAVLEQAIADANALASERAQGTA